MADGFSPAARAHITGRGHGRCQLCRSTRGLQAHHRRPRGKGGSADDDTNLPSNGILLCDSCHRWVEQHRADALTLGLLVRQGQDPEQQPAWLLLPYGWNWYTLHADGLVSMCPGQDDPDPAMLRAFPTVR